MDFAIRLDALSIQTPPQQTTPGALSLPEVLSCILSFLKGNRKTLRSAACVNQIWFDEATRLLWDTSDTAALIAVEASRRTIYAPKIRQFTLQAVFSHPNIDLDFRLLRVLHFTDFPGSQDASEYLQPVLEEIYFRAWPPTSILQELNVRCPKLRVMVQTKPFFKEKQKFIEFLASNQSLQRVQLTLIPLDKDRMLAAFLALSGMPKLEDLTVLGETYSCTLVRLQRSRMSDSEAASCSKPCFDSICRVKLTTSVPALSLLNSTFSAMTSISLVVHMRTEGQLSKRLPAYH